MKAVELIRWHGEHSERIVVYYVGFCSERNLRDILKFPDGFRPQSRIVEAFTVEWNVLVRVAYDLAELLLLNQPKLFWLQRLR